MEIVFIFCRGDVNTNTILFLYQLVSDVIFSLVRSLILSGAVESYSSSGKLYFFIIFFYYVLKYVELFLILLKEFYFEQKK